MLDVGENRGRVTRAIHVIGHTLEKLAKLMSAAMLPLEALFEIREKSIVLGDLAERGRNVIKFSKLY